MQTAFKTRQESLALALEKQAKIDAHNLKELNIKAKITVIENEKGGALRGAESLYEKSKSDFEQL